MIFYIGKFSIYTATHLKFLKFSWIPKVSYFDGGSYYKLSFYWFRRLIEVSHSKKDKKIYKQVTSKELDKILKNDIV